MITIDHDGAVPPFEQLRTQLVEAVASGALTPGEQLPTVRSLAQELGVAAGTVARAYRELEASGVVTTRGRAGTFVTLDADPIARSVQEAAAAYAARVRELGVDPASALGAVADALRVRE